MTLPTLGWLKTVFGDNANSFEEQPLNICIDSRKLSQGDVFWALRGSRDGHEFVTNALKSGASAAVVKRSFSTGNQALDQKLIHVDEPIDALAEAARLWRKEFSGKVLGLTGSVGKTTTKDFASAAVGNALTVIATEGNFNNEIGVPLTILRTPLETELLICEMGAARVGDIAHLCSIAAPDSGLVTAITDAHTESFGSIDNIMIGKGELYDFVKERDIAFVPLEDEKCVRASSSCRTRVGYGFSKPTTDWKSDYVHGERLEFDHDACAGFIVQGERIKLSVPGRPAAQAALAAMTIALHHNIPSDQAAKRISQAVPTSGRASIRKLKSLTIIDDSYNASPSSMRAALETLSMRQSGRKVAILGDMLELGEISDIAHREVVGELDRAGVTLAVLIGPQFSYVAGASLLHAQCRVYQNVDQALSTLTQLIRPNDLVLVKASRGMALDRVVKKLEDSFD